jgi:hypothetical protein
MRQLQKGDQEPRQRDHRRIRVASVLILRALRKTNYRVPEETEASSAQNDWIATQSRLLSQQKDRNSRGGFSFRLVLNEPWGTASLDHGVWWISILL